MSQVLSSAGSHLSIIYRSVKASSHLRTPEEKFTMSVDTMHQVMRKGTALQIIIECAQTSQRVKNTSPPLHSWSGWPRKPRIRHHRFFIQDIGPDSMSASAFVWRGRLPKVRQFGMNYQLATYL
ncbi:hypothetical protein AVEN_96389-1 [Araneus ventricosus]|uniref:Uncharacterized protein n=1 Tax=Araneus ventricosus TaxID=182803 RepID=A0A4Y2LUM6_ARAVE|nr:hypothetical protein AVEN_96389-1 [Araneus ventricosus]